MSLINVKITREINEHVPCQNHTLFQTKKVKTIPYFRLKQLENHTLKYGTYPYGLYIGVPPPPLPGTPMYSIFSSFFFPIMKLGLTDKFFPCSNLFPCASVLSLSCHALQSCEPSSIHSGVTHFNQRFLLVTDIAPKALVSLWVLYSPPMETKATSKSTQRTNARVCRRVCFVSADRIL